jgi:hypothetical protein
MRSSAWKMHDVSVDLNEDVLAGELPRDAVSGAAKMIRPLPSSPRRRSRILDGF